MSENYNLDKFLESQQTVDRLREQPNDVSINEIIEKLEEFMIRFQGRLSTAGLTEDDRRGVQKCIDATQQLLKLFNSFKRKNWPTTY